MNTKFLVLAIGGTIITIICLVWMIIMMRKYNVQDNKNLWIAACFFLPLPVSILFYLLIIRPIKQLEI